MTDPTQTGPEFVDIEYRTKPPKGMWVSALVRGLLLIAVGLVVVFFPVKSLQLLTILFGILAILGGLSLLWTTWLTRHTPGAWVLTLVPGLVFVAFGVVSVVWSAQLLSVFAIIWSIIAVLVGLWDVASSLTRRFPGWGWRLARGAIYAAAGVVVFLTPQLGVGTVGVLIAIFVILGGIMTTAMALVLRRMSV